MKLKITPEQKKKAKLYSEKVKVGYYAVKYGQPEQTARRQHYIGKLGEFALYNLFSKAGYKLLEPDCEIHNQKRHEADLLLGKHEIHIKTQRKEEAIKYGASWLFKKKSVPTTGLIALITIAGEEVQLEALLPSKTLLKRYKAPKLIKLQQDCVAIYKEDLPNNPFVKFLTKELK